jgi:serine O-acetyltransferase (EC 2.3.1.30)
MQWVQMLMTLRLKPLIQFCSHIHDMDEQLNIVSKKLDIKDQDDIDVDKLEIESK